MLDRSCFKFTGLLMLSSISIPAFSLEHPPSFSIDAVGVSTPDDLRFKVYADSTHWHCHNGPTSPGWSYIDESDVGAQTKNSVLLAAYLAGKTVTVKTVGVSSSGSSAKVCKIVEMLVEN